MITQSAEEIREANKELIRRFYATAFVEHDLDRAANWFLSPDYVLHDGALDGGRISGISAWCELQGNYLKRIPNHGFEILDQFAENDKVVTHWQASYGMDDQCFSIMGIVISRIVDGGTEAARVAEEWVGWDFQTFQKTLPPLLMKEARDQPSQSMS